MAIGREGLDDILLRGLSMPLMWCGVCGELASLGNGYVMMTDVQRWSRFEFGD